MVISHHSSAADPSHRGGLIYSQRWALVPIVTLRLFGKDIGDLVCWIGVQLDGANGAQTASSQEEFQSAP
jgi:hypothetical protein